MDKEEENLKANIKIFLMDHSIVELMNIVSEAFKETNAMNILNNLRKDEC